MGSRVVMIGEDDDSGDDSSIEKTIYERSIDDFDADQRSQLVSKVDEAISEIKDD